MVGLMNILYRIDEIRSSIITNDRNLWRLIIQRQIQVSTETHRNVLLSSKTRNGIILLLMYWEILLSVLDLRIFPRFAGRMRFNP